MYNNDDHRGPAVSCPRSINVLLVDDEKLSQALGQRLFEKNACNVDIASNGSEAVERFQNNSYDLVIVDYYLQDTQGDLLLEQLRNLPASQEVTFAVITNDLSDGCVRRCRQAGAKEVLAKPFVNATVVSLLSYICQQQVAEN